MENGWNTDPIPNLSSEQRGTNDGTEFSTLGFAGNDPAGANDRKKAGRLSRGAATL